MDVTSAGGIAAAVTAAAGSAGAEAGRHAWESLLGLCRRVGRGEQGDEIVLPTDSADEEQVRVLTARVIEESERDEGFAAELDAWAEQHGFTLGTGDGSVHNSVSGDARISGPLFQGRDFSGPISFGG